MTRQRKNYHVGATKHTQAQIARAVALTIQGKTLQQIADALQVTLDAIHYWKRQHAGIWSLVLDQQMAELVGIVRETAGTDAILADPDAYLQQAKAADRWTQAKGEALFPVGDQPTLTTFYETYYKPNRLGDAAPETLNWHTIVLRRWRLVTGDPPIAKITTGVLSKFRDVLLKCRGEQPHLRMAARTVRGYMSLIQTLLEKAGPAHYRNRDAAGIISAVPWAKPPRAESPMPRIVTPAHLKLVYDAAVAMARPRVPGFKAPAWWRALLVVAYNTGLRAKSLFTMRMENIDWAGHRLVLPPRRMKSRRWHVIHLNETTLEHLRTIRTDRELVFPWPTKSGSGLRPRHFYEWLHKLQFAAGIPKKNHFGLHDLRRTLATLLWQTDPQAAQFALDHADPAVTAKHYIQANAIVAPALDRLPQPWGDVGRKGGAA